MRGFRTRARRLWTTGSTHGTEPPAPRLPEPYTRQQPSEAPGGPMEKGSREITCKDENRRRHALGRSPSFFPPANKGRAARCSGRVDSRRPQRTTTPSRYTCRNPQHRSLEITTSPKQPRQTNENLPRSLSSSLERQENDDSAIAPKRHSSSFLLVWRKPCDFCALETTRLNHRKPFSGALNRPCIHRYKARGHPKKARAHQKRLATRENDFTVRASIIYHSARR